MKYIKLRVDFEEAEKGRFYRIVLVKHDIILQDLGSLLVLAFGGALVHSFLFRTETASYEPSVWVRATNDNAGNKRKTYAHCDHTIKELPTNCMTQEMIGLLYAKSNKKKLRERAKRI